MDDNATLATKKLLDAAIDARMPVMLVGAPGTGKSATVKQIARDRGYELITLVGSRMDPTDVAGLPKAAQVEVGEGEERHTVEATVYLAPDWQVRILTKRKVILFLDEYSNSSGAVQAAFLTILQDGEFPNGEKIPEETIIIGASNPAEEAADGYEMALPTTNRIFWISWSPTLDAWVKGMLNGWGQELPEEEMKWKRKIASFIKDNPTWLHQPPKDATSVETYGLNPNSSSDMEVFRYAWASRRSWDNLSRVLAHAPQDDTFVQDSIAQGIVGYAASADFRNWLRKHDNISPADVLADPKSVDWKKVSVDDANLIFRSIIEMIDEDTSAQAIEVFSVVADSGRAALAGTFVKDLMDAAMGIGKKFSAQTKAQNKLALSKVIPKYHGISTHSQ